MRYKDEYPAQARTLDALSRQEMDHMAMLHKDVVTLIEEYRRDRGEPPAEMLARYNWLHERHIKAAAEVRVLQVMFRES